MSDKKNVYISFNKAFVKENLKTKDGETFHAVTLPKGVIIDGVDRGLYRFTTKHIYDDKFNDIYTVLSKSRTNRWSRSSLSSWNL